MLTVRECLQIGLESLDAQRPSWEFRQRNFEGNQDLPFAPDGVNREYLALREQSVANFLDLAMNGPIQRLRADGFTTGRDKEADLTAWSEIWQANKLDVRQRIVYQQMMVHGRGIMAVSANPQNRASPKVTVENSRRVWLEPNPENPFETLFAVKTFTVRAPDSALILPASVAPVQRVAYVYDATRWYRFEARGMAGNNWVESASGEHNLGQVPFVGFDFNVDADGVPHDSISKLIPAQNAVNTIRFNTLLAMQFSAFRQRAITGFDPIMRDSSGNPIVKLDEHGDPELDENGQEVPVLQSPGRIGVDRALVFPGSDTKVFDLPESNLENYIKVYDTFLTSLFAAGQIPPQYLLTRMSNMSGDALASAESTLQALVKDLQTAAGESLEQVMRLANRARGEDYADVASEVIWGDAEARSFAQIVDAITKLISTGMSREDAWSMLPGATPPKVQTWVDNAEDEASRSLLSLTKESNDTGINEPVLPEATAADA